MSKSLKCTLGWLLLLLLTTKTGKTYGQDLYEAYLAGDMSVWGKYIADMEEKENLTIDEIAHVANYEYGYIAWCIDEKRIDEAKHRLDIFVAHIDYLEKHSYSPSVIAVYRSSVCAYQLSLYKKRFLQIAKEALAYSEKALELDPKNPMALTLQGNVKMYMPAMFGGSDTKALEFFLESEALMRKAGDVNNWNFRSLQLCIAQCYEKVDGKERAARYCEEVLAEVPNFVYLRDVYYKKLIE